MPATKKHQSKFSIQEVADLLGLRKLLDRIDDVHDFDIRLEEVEDETPEERETRYLKAEMEAQDDLYRKFMRGLNRVFDTISDDTGIVFTLNDDQNWVTVRSEDWKHAAGAIMEIINGDGFVYAGRTVKEFIYQSSANTPRQVVLQHLHWLKRRAAVYGTRSFERIVESCLE